MSMGLPCPLQVHYSPHISTCSSTWNLCKSCPIGFFMKACSIDMIYEIIGHWWLNSIFKTLICPYRSVRVCVWGWGLEVEAGGKGRCDWKFPPPNHMACPGNQPASLGAFQRPPQEHNKRHYLSQHLRTSKGFRSSVPKTGWRPNTYFLL